MLHALPVPLYTRTYPDYNRLLWCPLAVQVWSALIKAAKGSLCTPLGNVQCAAIILLETYRRWTDSPGHAWTLSTHQNCCFGCLKPVVVRSITLMV
jgi:hypothetical protein